MEFSLHAQTSRYFANQFVGGDASSAAKLVTREWLLSRVRSVAEQLLARAIPKDEYDDDGPYIGPSGIAYALLRVTKAGIGLDYTNRVLAILNDQHKHLPKVSEAHECRYLTGTLGFYTTQLLAGQLSATSFLDKIKKRLGLILTPGYQRIGDDEIMNGRAGVLAALLTIRTEKDGQELLPSADILALLNAIVQSGRTYSRKHHSPSPLMYQWHGDEYLGAAHGVSGILQILLSFWPLLDEESKRDLENSVKWYLGTQMPDGNFPSGTDRIGKKEELIHWCHGATGAIQMLIVAHFALRDGDIYLKAAQRCGELIWERGILRKGPGICHGVAGSGYAFLLLYRVSREELWLDRAKTFALVLMSENFKKAARTPDSPWSLFEGWAGALCFLTDLFEPLKAQFPMVPIPF